MLILSYCLAAVVGIALGLLGGGGSILAVPILVYVAGFSTKPAIGMSLFIVGATSLLGAVRHWRAKNVDFRTAIVFGLVSMAAAYAAGRASRYVSATFQLVLFAIVMLTAAVFMFRSKRGAEEKIATGSAMQLVAEALGVGALTGLVGVGGGFLIVPALVLLGVPMRRAVGTSLLVIAMNCAAGVIAYAGHVPFDWRFTLLFSAIAIAGAFVGSALVPHVSPIALKRGFAVFLIVIAAWILYDRGVRRAHDRARAKTSTISAPHDRFAQLPSLREMREATARL